MEITTNQQSELEKEQFFRFFQISTDIMAIVDGNGMFIKVNPAATRILGYSEEELMAQPFIHFVHDDDRQMTREIVERHFMEGASGNLVNRYVCKDGSVRWISWTTSIDTQDQIDFTTGRDITGQMLIEQQLKEQQAIHLALLDNSDDVITLYDRDHKCIYINPAVESLLGMKQDEVIGKTRYEFGFPEKLCQMWRQTIDKVFETGKAQYRFYEMDTRLGETSMDWHVFPGQRNSQGEVDSVFSVSRNVTPHRKVEEELQKMQRLNSIGVLAGGIAHDFNNILTVLFGNIAIAKEQLDNPQQCIKSLEKAESAYTRATHLTSQLLTFAKGGEPVKQDFSLTRLVRETVSFDLSGSNVKLQLEADEDLWMVKADKGQMAQVFSNLTINADQAMPNGGMLTISLENAMVDKDQVIGLVEGPYIRVIVSDVGAGIREDELENIFDPFYSNKQTGSGLGLATVYSIITKHGGTISVDSTPGEGARFQLYLPASNSGPHEDMPEGLEQTATGNKNCRILVMDDEEMICELAESILCREGYEVHTAHNGEQAITLYQKSLADDKPYHCVIMDLTIPGGLGGEEAVKELLALDPHANVIVSSGYAVDPVMANYAEFGFKGVITKPFTLQNLSKEIGRLMQR